jgi:hypothetical protein
MHNISYPPPTRFSVENKLVNASQKSEAIRIFPTKNKFSGQPGELGVVEFLYGLNHAQETCELSRNEFKDMMLICSTGRAHMLLLEWASNGESIETLYHSLLTHFDTRLTPGEAKAQLFSYRIPKTSNLAEAVAHIMDLAGRAASSLPLGESRNALYNLEAIECLLRALPPSAKITATNLNSQLSAKLGRSCTITELNRALNIYRHTIDNEIKSRGNPGAEGKKTFSKGKWTKKSTNSQNGPVTLAISSNPPTPNGGQQGGQGHQHGHQQGGQNKGAFPKNGNKGGKGKKFPKKGAQSLQYCSLCGAVDHLASSGCINMRDDKGAHVNIMPTHGTCNMCPMSVNPRLNHPMYLCPWRPGGPFSSN